MAVLVPVLLRSDAPKGEQRVFQALKGLNDTWYIFSHVFWQSKRSGREGDGEIDFVLLNPQFGIAVVEVKGGSIEIENGQWFSTGEHGRFSIKNPFEQATINKYALVGILREHDLSTVPVVHAVCFPNCSDERAIATYGPRDITWWSSDLNNVSAAVDRTFKHWGVVCRLENSAVRKIQGLLAPTTSFRRRLVDDVGQITEQLLRLTDEQLRVFEAIQRNRRAIVRGGPGTGKTLLSIERARRLSSQGFWTLWVCYNELLAKDVQRQLEDTPSVQVRTFHSLCMKQIHTAGHQLPHVLDQDFWERRAAHLFLDAAAATGTTFDAVVIDEGQDFSQEWIDALEVLISASKDPPIYIFADANQRLYRRDWHLPNCTELDLTLNCRSTLPIAKRVASVLGDPIPKTGANGPEPIFSELTSPKMILDRIESRVGALVEQEGILPSQITVLVDTDPIARRLRERYAGPYPFAGYGQTGVVVETIQRFKGLENDVIVVALTEATRRDEETRRLCYVAFSRARAVLMVVADPVLRRCVSW